MQTLVLNKVKKKMPVKKKPVAKKPTPRKKPAAKKANPTRRRRPMRTNVLSATLYTFLGFAGAAAIAKTMKIEKIILTCSQTLSLTGRNIAAISEYAKSSYKL